ncbi:TetR/AcrR family transcriptional regulator C-terminal domain-containing protein [Streptomyces bobili]|uniref:TetR/AcrR family transcriptional regulator C-terminal domain-containing protein n=1 Tax=Streptomyces bobili TaxID=67280 RepID=UPI00339FEE1E
MLLPAPYAITAFAAHSTVTYGIRSPGSPTGGALAMLAGPRPSSPALWLLREAGPAPVGQAFTQTLEALAEAGLLDVHGDAALAVTHFMALISHTLTQQSHHGVRPLPETETERLITGGAAAFLRAYRAA